MSQIQHRLAKRGDLRLTLDAALFEHALSKSVIGLDQTGWKSLDGKKDKPWQMWCITAPGVVCHRIRADKGAETFKVLVGKYVGTIVCDALKTHEAGAREGPGIVLAGCWAHTYRKFVGVETAKLHDVDPARYLRTAALAAERGEALLPWQLTQS